MPNHDQILSEALKLSPVERAELVNAISYYNVQSEGLGYEFAAEVKRTLESIVQYPDAWFRTKEL